MLSIQLSDNNYSGSPLEISENNVFPVKFAELSEEQKSTIRKSLDTINKVSLKQLEERGAIIFPSRSVESELNEESKVVCSVQGLETDNPIIKTTNIMGFFCIGNGVQISIYSRFDKSKKQYFLHHMLQKVCNVSPTVELTHANKNPFYEFMVYLFPVFLKKAVAQGNFRSYVNREYNDSNICGVIDFSRHIRYNIPCNGKVAYHTREYTQDNFVTQIIRHTIEYISENQELRKILSVDEDMITAVQKIRGCTPTYNKASRLYIINKNLNSLTHPYYTEYEKLRNLCKMILMHDKFSYNQTYHNQINGILFDGASLWEEYLTGLFQEYFKKNSASIIVEHPNNRTGRGKKYLFETESHSPNTAIYPDLIFRNLQNNYLSILDAKYKHLENGSISREDYFQVLSYMYRFDCKRGILLYPYSDKESSPDTRLYLAGHNPEISFSVHGLELYDYDDNCGYKDFASKMEINEDAFCNKIKETVLSKLL